MAKVSEGGGGGGRDEQELKLKKWSCQGHFGNSVVLLKLVKLRRDVAEYTVIICRGPKKWEGCWFVSIFFHIIKMYLSPWCLNLC